MLRGVANRGRCAVVKLWPGSSKIVPMLGAVYVKQPCQSPREFYATAATAQTAKPGEIINHDVISNHQWVVHVYFLHHMCNSKVPDSEPSVRVLTIIIALEL